MKNAFYCYKKQNDLCLMLVLLPFILIVKAIILLCGYAAKRLTTKKH